MRSIFTDRNRKNALISGGSSGIGKAIAAKLHREGIQPHVADISAGENDNSNGIDYIPCDITSGDSINNLYSCLSEKNQLPQILICNAGKGIHEKLTEGDPEKWKSVIDLNVIGALRLIRAFVPEIEKLPEGGDVVIVSSVAAGKTFPYGAVYNASKTALEIIAETLRLEVQPKVRVTVIAPGVTDTAFFKNSLSYSPSVEEIGWGALSPEDVADSVYYAISRPRGISLNHIIMRPTAQEL